jgi:hypothetical protein
MRLLVLVMLKYGSKVAFDICTCKRSTTFLTSAHLNDGVIRRLGKVIGPGNGAYTYIYVHVCKNKYRRKHAVCKVTV